MERVWAMGINQQRYGFKACRSAEKYGTEGIWEGRFYVQCVVRRVPFQASAGLFHVPAQGAASLSAADREVSRAVPDRGGGSADGA